MKNASAISWNPEVALQLALGFNDTNASIVQL